MSEQLKTKECADYMAARLKSALELYRRKNVAYGDSFGKSIEEFGYMAAFVRIGDKINRAKSLLSGNKNEVEDEAVQDTLTDLAMYAMMLAYEVHRSEVDKAEAEAKPKPKAKPKAKPQVKKQAVTTQTVSGTDGLRTVDDVFNDLGVE